LFAALPLKIRQFCETVKGRIARGEEVDLILDSTGLRFGKASHWYEQKYGKPCENRPWRKMHIAIDHEMNMHGIEITDVEDSDIGMMDALMPKDESQPIGKVIADGAYYSIKGTQSLHDKGIVPVIPPPKHSVIHDKEHTKWHDATVQYIKDKGIYAFHKKYGYGKRSLVEAQISRIKRCIGPSLLTQREQSQKNEGKVIANIINQWNSFGRCISVKTG
jgi:transposase